MYIGIKRNLFWFTEGQTNLNTSWDGKMSLTHNDLIENVPRSNLPTTSKHAPKNLPNWKILYAKQPTPDKKFH